LHPQNNAEFCESIFGTMRLAFINCLILLLLLGCKPESNTSPQDERPAEIPTDSASLSKGNPNLVANMPYTFLTDEMFHHRITVISGKPDEESNKGHWLDLHDNGTYDYGIWDKQTYSGQWKYDDNSKLLELRPSGNEKPTEWRVMYRDDNLYLAGTVTYGNNSRQAHWVRMPDKPRPGGNEQQ
jgi:hypothetical protein